MFLANQLLPFAYQNKDPDKEYYFPLRTWRLLIYLQSHVIPALGDNNAIKSIQILYTFFKSSESIQDKIGFTQFSRMHANGFITERRIGQIIVTCNKIFPTKAILISFFQFVVARLAMFSTGPNIYVFYLKSKKFYTVEARCGLFMKQKRNFVNSI